MTELTLTNIQQLGIHFYADISSMEQAIDLARQCGFDGDVEPMPQIIGIDENGPITNEAVTVGAYVYTSDRRGSALVHRWYKDTWSLNYSDRWGEPQP